MARRAAPPCPHCGERKATLSTLDMHLRFLCPVLRPGAVDAAVAPLTTLPVVGPLPTGRPA